jgi:glycosyltransferase involved in cell wall biosynthesis
VARQPVKVLHIIDTLGVGGAETWLLEVLRLWSRNGAGRLDFLVTSGNRGAFDEEARELGAKIYYVRYGRTQLLRFADEFRSILREGQYHAIHDHQDFASGWHFLMGAGVLPKIRITHVHNPAYQIRNNYGVTASRRLVATIGKDLVARYATHITGTSRQVLAEYGFNASRFKQIPKLALYCGFDATRFHGDVELTKNSVCREFGWPENSNIILCAGRIDQSPDLGHPQNHKNSGFAISVAMECMRRDARARLLLAGATSAALPVLQRRIAAAGFAERIQFVGIRKDVARLMIASNVLLFPSRGEGLGMAAVEAQAAGLPVLASTVVPRECVVVPELVHFQKLEDGVAQWAADLLQIAAQKPRRIAEANQRVANSHFAISRSADALFQLYTKGALT